MFRLLALVAFLGAANALRTDESVNPIRRIVTLLQNMQKEVAAEGDAEKKNFDKFMCYCEGNTKQMTKEAEAARQTAEAANARAEEKSAEKKQLDLEIAEHKKDRAEAKGAVAQATEIRNKEHAKYVEEAGDNKKNIDALSNAIGVLGKGMGGSFLQTGAGAIIKKLAVQSTSMTTFEREDLLNFLQGKSKGAFGDYQAASGEIVGILKQMKDDIDKDLNGIVAAEEEAQQSFDELVAAKNNEIKAATSAIEVKTVRAGEAAVAIQDAKHEAKTALESASESDRFLANMAMACKTKSEEWDERCRIRNEELAAIADAIKVLNDDDALDIFKKTLPSPGAISLLQRGRSTKGVFQAAFNQVHGASVATNSRRLKMVAYLLQQGKVSFAKVLKMIDSMIDHLGKEQNDDDSQFKYCNKELASQNDSAKDLQKDVNANSSQIDALASQISELNSQIKELEKQVKDLDNMVAEATDNRKSENSEFQKSQMELTAATSLINKAKNRLAKHYAPELYVPPKVDQMTEEERISGIRNEPGAVEYIPGTTIPVDSGTGLVQAAPAPPPATWEGSYKSSGKSKGVMGLMDMLLKDLETQLQEGKHDEEVAQKDYEQNMADAKAERATMTGEIADKTSLRANAEMAKQEAEGTRRANVAELGDVNDTIQKLHGSCDFLLNNFDLRKAARATETDSLKNAKAVLNGADYK